MRAITLYPWYAWAVEVLDKTIENRGWRAPFEVGEWVAIHAGVRRLSGDRSDASPLMQFVADLSGAGWHVTLLGAGDLAVERAGERHVYSDARAARGAVVVVASYAGQGMDGTPPWGRPGCWRWRLANRMPLPRPVGARGQQGVWRLPPAVIEGIRGQVPDVVLGAGM